MSVCTILSLHHYPVHRIQPVAGSVLPASMTVCPTRTSAGLEFTFTHRSETKNHNQVRLAERVFDSRMTPWPHQMKFLSFFTSTDKPFCVTTGVSSHPLAWSSSPNLNLGSPETHTHTHTHTHARTRTTQTQRNQMSVVCLKLALIQTINLQHQVLFSPVSETRDISTRTSTQYDMLQMAQNSSLVHPTGGLKEVGKTSLLCSQTVCVDLTH